MAATTIVEELDGPSPRGARASTSDQQLRSQISLLYSQVSRLNAQTVRLISSVEACDSDGLTLYSEKADLYADYLALASLIDDDRGEAVVSEALDEYRRKLSAWQLRARAWLERMEAREHELRDHLTEIDLREVEVKLAVKALYAEGATGLVIPAFDRPQPRYTFQLVDYDRLVAAAGARDVALPGPIQTELAPLEEAHKAYMDLFGW